MNTGLYMVKFLYFNIIMFVVSIYGSANVSCNNEEIYKNTTTPDSVLNKKHNFVSYHNSR